jgi:hypothetical protein
MLKAFVSVGAVQLLSAGIHKAIGPSNLPLVYRDVSKAYKQGKLDEAGYAALIAAANKEMEKRYDPQSPDPMMVALAEQYKAENVSPADIVKEMASHKFEVRMHKILEANEAKAPTHVEKVTGAKPAVGPVVGAHTANVNAQAAQRGVETPGVA